MSEKPTTTTREMDIPATVDPHHFIVPTTIHAPIGGREICITTASEYDRFNCEVNIPPFHICAAPIERFVPTCSVDGADLERLDIYIDPDNALRCGSKKRFQKLLMAMTIYGRNDAAAATANNRDYWTCHGLKRSESYQLKWLRVIFPEDKFTIDYPSPVDNPPLKTKDFAHKHFMGRIAAENLWREYEKERLNRKEEHK